MPLIICFCGGDLAWEELVNYGFRRRNTCLLKGFVEHPEVDRIYVISTVTRDTWLQKRRDARARPAGTPKKVVDVFVARLLPERWWLPGTGIVNRFLARRQARRQMPELDARPPVVWCYWPKGFRLAEFLNLPGKWIFDADHNIVDDVNGEAGEPAEVRRLLLRCARRSKLMVAASRSMLDWFRQRGAAQCAHLRNGVDPTRFNGQPPVPAAVARLPRPRVGYIGTLSRWVDYNLLAGLARKRPDWSFVIAGPALGPDKPEGFDALPNVTFLGPQSEAEVPAFLGSLDVGLALYNPKFSSWVDVDSMKLFEYLAAGIPVVSTRFHPHLEEDFCGLLQLAEGVEGFEKAIELLLAGSPETDAETVRRRGEFLARNTWTCRSREAVRLMQGL